MSDSILKIEQEVLDFIIQNTHADSNKINKQTLLFKEGVFDSMGFVLLIDFIESKFSITIDDTEFIEENFESLNAISNFVQKKIMSKVA